MRLHSLAAASALALPVLLLTAGDDDETPESDASDAAAPTGAGALPVTVEHKDGETVGSQAEISAENVGLIDADVVVFATEDDKMFDVPQGLGA